jgi:hypothetical protein
MLLQMVNGGIINITTDSDSFGGCETCDYGSSYINEFKVEMTTGDIEIKVDNMYEFALSEGYMMQTILPKVDEIKGKTEQEFFEWLKEKVTTELEGRDRYTRVEEFTIEFKEKDE